eukprot:6195430-Pleurochrysis_carterae.AAC.2
MQSSRLSKRAVLAELAYCALSENGTFALEFVPILALKISLLNTQRSQARPCVQACRHRLVFTPCQCLPLCQQSVWLSALPPFRPTPPSAAAALLILSPSGARSAQRQVPARGALGGQVGREAHAELAGARGAPARRARLL